MEEGSKPTYLRFFHGFPEHVAVDLYLDDRKMTEGLPYHSFTPYTGVDPGRYRLTLYPAGERDAPLLKHDVLVPAGELYTLLIGDRQGLPALAPVEDSQCYLTEGRSALRFGNFAVGMEAVNALFGRNDENPENFFQDVEYGQMSEYALVSPGLYTMELQAAKGGRGILWMPDLRLQQNRYYSVYMLGRSGKREEEFPILAIIPQDGDPYL